MSVSVCPNPGHTEGSVTGGSGGSLRRFLREAEFSLRERFESSLPEQISHFSSRSDALVSFGVHWDAVAIAALSGAVETGLWPRAQPRAAVFASCSPDNTCKGLKTSLGGGGNISKVQAVCSPLLPRQPHTVLPSHILSRAVECCPVEVPFRGISGFFFSDWLTPYIWLTQTAIVLKHLFCTTCLLHLPS